MILDPAYAGFDAHAVGVAFGVLAGFGFGWAHFGALAWTVRCFADGVALSAVALQLCRLALIVVAFIGLSRLGAGMLLGGLGGLVLARQAVLRRLGGAP